MKKYRVIAILIFTMLLSLVLAGCSEKSNYDKLLEEGYTVTVTYDPNGGNFVGGSNVTLVDMFNPANYKKGDDGKVRIKLLDPTSNVRNEGQKITITISNQGDYFLAGWYKNKKLVKNSDGKVVDWDGNVLEEKDGRYYVKQNGQDVETSPAYKYSDYWNFSTDTLDVTDYKELSLTLYAGWVPYYKFVYYRESTADDKTTDKWVKYGETLFDYNTSLSNQEVSTLYLPKYVNGAMNYKINQHFQFPSLEGYTFDSCYTDENCTTKITDDFKHPGTFDYATARANQNVQNVYVKFNKGEIYYIETAEQLYNNANVNGIYYITSDLDFSQYSWSNRFQANTFDGQIYGQNHTFKNLNVKYNSTSAEIGGLFGSIGDNAVIKDLTFDGITYDYLATKNTKSGNFGLFSGDISQKAQLTNVTVQGEVNLRIGDISLDMKVDDENSRINFYLFAGGNVSGITLNSDVNLVVYGASNNQGKYRYAVEPETIKVQDGKIRFTRLVKSTKALRDNKEYPINYKTGE